ncbi:hypothetical protein GcC1_05737 [Golovinomyces cichoracearum]|uniref:DUF659 domain-containing protein n=1 Tax=Golovinomyces cichoracearum TaxID=62708 RepID=A0A420IVY8_9PEZI|nr:hypothetical protein GcC1_05737 [Golovinomyces cichoracearum]
MSIIRQKFHLRAIIPCALAFSIVNNYYFRAFIQYLRPGFRMPHRTTLATHYLNYEYANAVLIDRATMARLHNFTLLLDGWADRARHSLYVFQAHAVTLNAPLLLATLDVTSD